MFWKKRENMKLSWFNLNRKMEVIPERVLIIHPFGIGDALFITPVIRTLKENRVKQIDLLLGSRTRELFERNPHVNQIFEWGKSEPKTWSECFRYWTRSLQMFSLIRRNRYQIVFDFSLARTYAFLSWLFFGIPIRIGFDFKGRGTFLTQKIRLENGFSEKPVADYYRDLLELARIRNGSKQLEFYFDLSDEVLSNQILDQAGLTGRSFMVVVPGGGESWGKDARLKRWPIPFFASLVRRICSEERFSNVAILAVGGANERSLGDELKGQLQGLTVHNFCGITSIRVAASLIQKAVFVLANDSGLVHIARSVNAPVVAFYGPVDPKVYGPYPNAPTAIAITHTGPECRPCYRRMRYQADCMGHECLTTLTPAHAFHLIRSSHFFEQIAANLVPK